VEGNGTRHAPQLEDWDDVEADVVASESVSAEEISPELALTRQRIAQGFWSLPGKVESVTPRSSRLLMRLLWTAVAMTLLLGTAWAALH
jgi:hypothetical protein